ncbi:hypothetical protein [Caloranaerobacter sp. DY30410]|uniref:hypothetical protein n=1 Tax=Caloranaerobacter sp. DY30410 TaxID=3238305 RepID=UPI003D01D4D5
MDQFAMKLAKSIEKLAIEQGMDLKECIEAGIDLLRMQQMKQSIDTLKRGGINVARRN